MKTEVRGRPDGPYAGMTWNGRRWVEPRGDVVTMPATGGHARRWAVVGVLAGVLFMTVAMWWESGYQQTQRGLQDLVTEIEKSHWDDPGVPDGFPARLAYRGTYTCPPGDAACYAVTITALEACPAGALVILEALGTEGNREAALTGRTGPMAAGESRLVIVPSPTRYPQVLIYGAGCVAG